MAQSAYKTFQIWIKPGHRLFSYLEQRCQEARHLYNTTNFYIRQVFTSFRQDKPLQPLQREALNTLQQYIGAMNENQLKAYRSRLAREACKPVEERREVRCNRFDLPSPGRPMIAYPFLDCLFKVMGQADYRALPAQSGQWVMKSVFQAWKSFFASIQDYRQHPDKYNGIPRIPSYSKAKGKEILFTNQDCVIKERKFLKFPMTSVRLNIGKLGYTEGKLKQVRVVPRYGQYVAELIFEILEEPKELDNERYMAIDPGIDNLATIVTTTGSPPVLVKGKFIKAINQYYNKLKAHYSGILRQGKSPKEGPYTSRRLERLHRNRHRRIKDLFHKASYRIVQLAAEQNIGTIIIGHNEGWKQEADMGKRNNQSFCHIPHHLLKSMIRYKAAGQGIKVRFTEEAYTSKASFLDHDPLPAYKPDEPEQPKPMTFSGRRVHRGLYRSQRGWINADVNGAANIMRKVVPNVTADGIAGLGGNQSVNVSTPRALSIR